MPDPLAIEVDSAVLPPIVLTPLSAGTAGGNPVAARLLRLVKPSVTVRLNGTQVYHVAPVGEPGQTAVLALLLVVAILGLAAVGLYSLCRRKG